MNSMFRVTQATTYMHITCFGCSGVVVLEYNNAITLVKRPKRIGDISDKFSFAANHVAQCIRNETRRSNTNYLHEFKYYVCIFHSEHNFQNRNTNSPKCIPW